MNPIMRTDVVESCVLLEHKMDFVANNMANISTYGFKRDDLSFREALVKASDGQMKKIKEVTVRTDFSPGDPKSTGNPLDFALAGPGFFKVQTPDGIRYTRNGNFCLSGESILTTPDGYPVLGQGGAITLAGWDVEVNDSGGISIDQSGDGTMVEADRFDIVDFEDPGALEKMGNSLFRLKDSGATETAAEGVQVRQGALEFSNVNVVKEMVSMIQLQRNYESYRKILQFLDEIDARLFNETGRLTG
ncbi:MAG: flagellar basal-body rod protein FlgF [Pseudomonadota bacterium]